MGPAQSQESKINFYGTKKQLNKVQTYQEHEQITVEGNFTDSDRIFINIFIIKARIYIQQKLKKKVLVQAKIFIEKGKNPQIGNYK